MATAAVQTERVETPAAHRPAASSAPAPRLVSLDAFRGFTMLWIIGGAAIARALAIPVLSRQMEHTPWRGLRYYDVIWPSFMLMVGVSVAFSHASRAGQETPARELLHAFRRAAVLFLLGSLRTSVSTGSAAWIELSSALQPIAVAYLAAFLLAARSTRVHAAAAAAILGGYGLLLHFVAAPGSASGPYEPGMNLVTWVDLRVLGRTHPEGWGTVLSTIPTVATTLIGLLIGGLLLSTRSTGAKLRILTVAGIAGIAAGHALDPWVPIVMKLWTSSYGIATAGWACLLFAFFYWVFDGIGARRGSLLFVVIGSNAIAAYLAGTLVPLQRIVAPFTQLAAPNAGALAPVLRPLAAFALEWLVLFWLYRRRIFLKA
jgi:predicted acyltransferase